MIAMVTARYSTRFSKVSFSVSFVRCETYNPVKATIAMPIAALNMIAVFSLKIKKGTKNTRGKIISTTAVTLEDLMDCVLESPRAMLAMYMEKPSASELLILRPTMDAMMFRRVLAEDHMPKLIPSTVMAELTTPKEIPCLKAFDSTSLSNVIMSLYLLIMKIKMCPHEAHPV